MLYNTLYYDGVAREVGGAHVLWRLVATARAQHGAPPGVRLLAADVTHALDLEPGPDVTALPAIEMGTVR